MTGDVTNDPALVGKLVTLFNKTPSQELVTNLSVTMQLQTFGGTDYPVSISDPPNCYICCPSMAYLDYAIEETRHFTANPVLQKSLNALISACRPLMRATGLDHQVQVNNWLFSTNPVPLIDLETATEIRDELSAAHPARAVVIRSLNDIADVQSMAALTQAGFFLLPARQIYVVDHTRPKPASVDMKRDRKLLEKTEYTLSGADTFSASDWTRATALYHMLYVDKYTALNPQYTPGFLAQGHQIGLLRIIGLRGRDGILDGVAGMFQNGKTMTVPLIGYDTAKPQELGLYRMLNAIAQRRAAQSASFYNLSAGAAGFKRHRNGVPAIEYTAVYVGHLGLKARSATRLVQLILTHVGVPLLQRFAL